MAFKGKVVIVTGASSGIGAATAKHLSAHGASLVLVGRNEANLLETVRACEANSSVAPYFIIGDLTQPDFPKSIVDKTIKKFGRIDVLVNNAGIIEMGNIENTSMEQYDRVFNTNVRAVYSLTHAAVPHLIESKGNIVNVSSVTGTRSFPGVLAYCMSKSALDQFTQCVALELADKKVRCNSVNPGVIKTELQKRGGLGEKDYEAFLKKSQETHALGRPGEPEEVAKAISFLASDNASFTTGQLLHVDGGRHVMCPR